MDELILNLLANSPTFAGLVILAVALQRELAELRAMYKDLMDDYNDLVLRLIERQVITAGDLRGPRGNVGPGPERFDES